MPGDALLDSQAAALVHFAAAIATGDETALRRAAADAVKQGVHPVWVEELLLQSILMVGYPRALVAFGVWRSQSGSAAPAADPDADYARADEWETRGVATCATVYGMNYDKLRQNVRQLHPAVDRWMLIEGYGRTLSRPGLGLMHRELCTVAQTAVLRTHRQLHSHLRGALNAGASFRQVESALSAARPFLPGREWDAIEQLWVAVRAGRTEES